MKQAASGVVVVGAGIVGLSAAWHLRRRGLPVTLLDRGEPGAGASHGNAGALSSGSVAPLAMPGVLRSAPAMLLDPNGPLHIPLRYWLRAAPWLFRFVRASRPAEVERIAGALASLLAYSIERHEEMLRAIGGRASGLIRRDGQLYLYRDAAALAKDEPSWSLRRRHGLRTQTLDRAGLLALEPAVGPAYTLAVFTPDQGMSTNPHRQALIVAEDFVTLGGRILREAATGITVEDDRVTGVRTEAGHHPASHVVLCAGAWSTRLLAPLGYRVPLESQRGYHVTVPDAGIALTRPVVAADRKVFFTPMETGLRAAGTVEFGGLERAPTAARAALLLRDLAAVFPQATASPMHTTWMGHRPCLPDSLPVIGPSARHTGLWFGFGHGHLGLTGAAVTGDIIARGIAGEPGNIDLAPFHVERFGRTAPAVRAA